MPAGSGSASPMPVLQHEPVDLPFEFFLGGGACLQPSNGMCHLVLPVPPSTCFEAFLLLVKLHEMLPC